MMMRASLFAGLLVLTLVACEGTVPQEACPLLAPGALVDMERLALGGEMLSEASNGIQLTHPELGPGRLLAVSFHSDGFETITVSVATPVGIEIFAWGPRDTFGGFAHCAASGKGTASFEAATRGEFLVGLGLTAGDGSSIPLNTIVLRIERRRDIAAPSRPPCEPLEALGCGAIRCDGELESDTSGCLTCNCRPGSLCGPERTAGPGGSCVLPACDCDEATGGPVCGADGRTWPSACAANCAAVPVAMAGSCEVTCPALGTCSNTCFGRRRSDPESGCPTCDCMPVFAPDVASCAACPVDPAPVCGSDGLTWLNRCVARCGGARILYAGACDSECSRAPDACDLDCPFGLAPAAEGVDDCLDCRCAQAPTFDCPTFGANACVSFGPADAETTVANACTALSLGATAGRWGSCAWPCATSAECESALAAAGISSVIETSCPVDGFMSNRCRITDIAGSDCGCSDLIDPVCGGDGQTHLNLCAARCKGVAVAHPGACCDVASPECDAGLLAELDTNGCATGACVSADSARRGRGCADNARTALACVRNGTAVDGSACENILRGIHARPEFCR